MLVMLGLVLSILGGMCGFLGLLTSAGGGSGGGEYWARGCVTGDGTVLLVSGSESQVIEVATGRVLGRRPGYGNHVACSASAAVAFLQSDEAWIMPGGSTRRVQDMSVSASAIVLRPDSSLVVLDRNRDPSRHPDSTLQMTTRTFDAPVAPVLLPASSFGQVSLGPGSAGGFAERDFVVRLADVLDDGRLLLLAGIDGWSGIGRHEWAFFALDPASRQLAELGPPHAPLIMGRAAWNEGMWARHVGAGFVVAAQADGGWRIATYDAASPAPRSDVRVTERMTLGGASFSRDGSRVAVALEDPDADTVSVALVDAATGQSVWRQDGLTPRDLAVLHLLDDGSVVYATTHRHAARVDASGRNVWTMQ